MNNFLQKIVSTITRAGRQFLGLLPTRLPVGVDEFEAYIQSVRQTYTLPTVSDEDVRYVIASLIIHLGPTAAYRPKFYFFLALRATASKQIASYYFQQVKLRQDAARKAAQQAQIAEATASQAVTSSGNQK